jgi:hypothetical protein
LKRIDIEADDFNEKDTLNIILKELEVNPIEMIARILNYYESCIALLTRKIKAI